MSDEIRTIRINQGLQGPTGATGPQGSQGPAGADGAPGAGGGVSLAKHSSVVAGDENKAASIVGGLVRICDPSLGTAGQPLITTMTINTVSQTSPTPSTISSLVGAENTLTAGIDWTPGATPNLDAIAIANAFNNDPTWNNSFSAQAIGNTVVLTANANFDYGAVPAFFVSDFDATVVMTQQGLNASPPSVIGMISSISGSNVVMQTGIIQEGISASAVTAGQQVGTTTGGKLKVYNPGDPQEVLIGFALNTVAGADLPLRVGMVPAIGWRTNLT